MDFGGHVKVSLKIDFVAAIKQTWGEQFSGLGDFLIGYVHRYGVLTIMHD